MSYLDAILKQSPWLLDRSVIDTRDIHLTRLRSFPFVHYEQAFLDYAFQDGVYIVTGPRQIGKSTHLKMLIQRRISEETKTHFFYFNCDLLDTKKNIVDLVEEYLAQFPCEGRRYLLLDEITSVKDSFMAIKFLVDSGYDKNITYILTGSNTISIKKTGEYLPGRRGKGIDFYFSPLSFQTFLQLQYPELDCSLSLTDSVTKYYALKSTIPLTQRLEDYLMTGGFPRVMNEYYQHGVIHDDIFTIYRSWLTSEIAKADKKEHIAKRILERSLLCLGSDVSYQALAEDAGVGSHNTIYDYLDFFENSHVLSLAFNYDIHAKRINYRKNKKIYFNDPFIYAVIEAWLSAKPQQDYDYLRHPILKSRLIENLVFTRLQQLLGEVHFYREAIEIDFVAKGYLLEVKYQTKIVSEDYRSLSKEAYRGILVSKQALETQGALLTLPIEYFLLVNSLSQGI